MLPALSCRNRARGVIAARKPDRVAPCLPDGQHDGRGDAPRLRSPDHTGPGPLASALGPLAAADAKRVGRVDGPLDRGAAAAAGGAGAAGPASGAGRLDGTPGLVGARGGTASAPPAPAGHSHDQAGGGAAAPGGGHGETRARDARTQSGGHGQRRSHSPSAARAGTRAPPREAGSGGASVQGAEDLAAGSPATAEDPPLRQPYPRRRGGSRLSPLAASACS